MERKIVGKVKELGKAGFAPHRAVCSVVFGFELPHKFNNEEEMARYNWRNCFTDRNSDAAESGEEAEADVSESPAYNSAILNLIKLRSNPSHCI